MMKNIKMEKQINTNTKQSNPNMNMRRCNSRTQCDPSKPGVKTILPNDCTAKTCENCFALNQSKEQAKRTDKMQMQELYGKKHPDKIYESSMVQQPTLCSTCRTPKPIDCTTKTCDECRERAAKYRSEQIEQNKSKN